MSSLAGTPATAPASPRWTFRLLLDPALILILLLGLYFRVQYIHLPMAEAHRWREVTNADIARQFYERSWNIFYPQVNWGGAEHPFVGMEFPLMHVIVAMLYQLFGEQTIIGRWVSIVFSLGTVIATYLCGTWWFGKPAGRAAAFLIAISPSAIFFGRFFISDTPMVFFSALAMFAWSVYFDVGGRRWAVIASVAAAMAFLVKIPAMMIGAPICWLAWEAKRWRALKDPDFMIGMTAAVLATVLWYWHADRIYHWTGLAEAISHPSGTYGPPISLAAGPFVTISHWATKAQLTDPWFYDDMLTRAWNLHLTPVGFVLAMYAWFAMWRYPRRRVLDVWMGIVLLFILVTAEGNRHHEFHQLPGLPPAALLFGLAAAPAFDGAWLREKGGRLAFVGSAVALVTLALVSFRMSGVVRDFFRPQMLDIATIQAGQAIAQVSAPDELLVTVEYEQYGNNSPILLYWAHRRGWSFDLAAITPHVIDLLKRDYHARYFTTTVWDAVQKNHPDVVAYLNTRRQVNLPGNPRNMVLYDLDQPASATAQ